MLDIKMVKTVFIPNENEINNSAIRNSSKNFLKIKKDINQNLLITVITILFLV